MHPLTLVATGIYGKPLPKQHGAPVRIVVPWNYGYKSIKSIVKIEFIDQQPKTFWETLQPQEYPFESNVNPAIPHPRWSQATERVMAVEEFRRIYRSHLEDFLSRLFVPDRLHRRIDEIAAVIRAPIAAQSELRLDKFEQAVGLKPVHPSPGERPYGPNHPAHEIKRFIDQRAESVRRQLDGKSRGMILKYPKGK